MIGPIHDAWTLPEHHPNLVYWIAFLLASNPIWKVIKYLPVWGSRIRYNQRAIKIRVLESLHQNPYGLVLYLADGVVDVAIEFSTTCLGFLLVLRSIHVPISASSVILFLSATLGSSIVGRSFRLRGIISGLKQYDRTIASLRAKQNAYLR